MDLPGVPSSLWSLLLVAAGTHRIALVGGAVRDVLLHKDHFDPWRGLVDLDLTIEGPYRCDSLDEVTPIEGTSPAWRLVAPLRTGVGVVSLIDARPHGQYGTVELELELAPSGEGSAASSSRLLLDVATARNETYPVPAGNPVVKFGRLEDDLARRDFTINAMAIELATGTLIDPHGGQADLAARRLRFLHPGSLRDDPSRLVRAARYAARLGFQLAPESASQAASTLAAWPWPWRLGDIPVEAPPALGTRLRRELELLLEREPRRLALQHLQAWGGLVLLDPLLQADQHWPRRLHWATRLRLPLLPALIAVAQDPLALAERLQIPHRQHTILRQFEELRRRLAAEASADAPPSTPWQWCQLLEAPGLSPQAVALALACGLPPRRPLLRWLLRWRHLGPEVSAQGLIAAGVPKGPELGAQLRRSRQRRLERERP